MTENEQPDWYDPEIHEKNKEHLEETLGYALEPAEEPFTYRAKDKDIQISGGDIHG